jgi:hypothetical protein
MVIIILLLIVQNLCCWLRAKCAKYFYMIVNRIILILKWIECCSRKDIQIRIEFFMHMSCICNSISGEE